MGRGDYHYRHEPIFHGWFGGAARLHPVPRTVDTVFESARPGASKEHPTMKPGEVYELGPHRLACGACTAPAVWDAVVGDERLRCVWTDPPYGVSYVGGTGLTIQTDAMTPEDTAALWSDAFAQ